ncbi:MAG TPA: zinc-ribbon domain-containing protein [Thermohalobaculum sp.]|nr:zinc-ribbon domain-containing protein [Thermohalobaculum sp.]
MIEIVCPSCQARYRLPEGAVGENGRRVSCSACGHSWHAYPEPEEETLTLGPEAIAEPASGAAEPPGAPSGAAKSDDKYAAYDSDERLSGTSPYSDEEDRGMAAYEAFAKSQEDDEDGEGGDAPAGRTSREEELAGDRAQQMSQIRSMLDDIKQSPQATPAAADEDDEEEDHEEPTPQRPSAVERSMREVEEEERDPLRAKLDQYAKPRKVGDAKVTRSRMLKKHAKKVRRRKMEEKRGTGTFMTGFLLVVLVVSVMAAVYLLSPLIIERFPESEPAIRDYVATMDQFRLWMGQQVGAAQEQIQQLVADEE